MSDLVPFNAEFYYAMIIMGISIPVFVHYAMKYIRENWRNVPETWIAMKLNIKQDWARTKELLRRKN